jgi:hypothetical protein
VLRGVYDWGVSMWNSTADDIVIAFASFVFGRMVSATKGAFCWGIPAFRAIHTIVLAATFDARTWPIPRSAKILTLVQQLLQRGSNPVSDNARQDLVVRVEQSYRAVVGRLIEPRCFGNTYDYPTFLLFR